MRNRFLSNLLKRGVIKIVEPSADMKDSYIKKSDSNLESAKILLKERKLEESIALTYYSMYNIIMALFFYVGIKCLSHSASMIILKEVFNIDNQLISNAKKERIDKQYYSDFIVDKEQVTESIESAEEFNPVILDLISRMKNEDIEKYRSKLKLLVNENNN